MKTHSWCNIVATTDQLQKSRVFNLEQLGERLIIGGHINTKHVDGGSTLAPTKGNEFREAVRDVRCDYQSTGEPKSCPKVHKKLRFS